MPHAIAIARFWAVGALLIVFGAQAFCSVVWCNTGPFGLFVATLIALLPAIGMALTKNPYSSVGASLAILPILIWANYMDCAKPYVGGGASMTYVLVFLFGIPFSLLVGLFVGWLVQPTRVWR